MNIDLQHWKILSKEITEVKQTPFKEVFFNKKQIQSSIIKTMAQESYDAVKRKNYKSYILDPLSAIYF
jgi:hypothetical protein